MTVNDYIQQKFQTFGIQLSEADLLDMCLNSKISGEDEKNEDCHAGVRCDCEVYPLSIASRNFN